MDTLNHWHAKDYNAAPRDPAFEREVRRLHLTDKPLKEWFHSPALRKWVGRNYLVRYVPEELLRMWGMEILEVQLDTTGRKKVARVEAPRTGRARGASA